MHSEKLTSLKSLNIFDGELNISSYCSKYWLRALEVIAVTLLTWESFRPAKKKCNIGPSYDESRPSRLLLLLSYVFLI
ncbi:hypothetical protein MPTK1_3g23700 [Marchantia polymorpha subsp. ruderalis]|uniref:Uncharacterized protein n=2 Tax=Marchantia polymorpha TaxID=3197 RepID=A0AAF6B426_MARPO|nr:hypothetical protein MARPO_0121s0052 [Marchantia polymorpha]BBN06760.1 hypothetical protein Mp_3g23700 [Marchantia polymorpha subsp. ruderalis]|eukprot:PTQ30715.1 hypothetical protein MARPO_0121s0052 [Marchantia polymorpha]